MTTDSIPYEFSEALEQRDAPNSREIALKITQSDRNWFKKILLPNRDARQASDDPMHVEKILLNAHGMTLAELVGALLMRPGTSDCAYLYTPGFGIEHFDTRAEAIDSLLDRLAIKARREELMRFVAFEIKRRITFDTHLQLKTEPIEGAVFLDWRRSIDRHEKHNLESLGEELLKLPSLANLLDKMLDDELARRFANIDLTTVRMISYVSASRNDSDDTGDPQYQPVTTHSLSDALLAHYRAGAWPAGQRRVFVAPGYNAVPADVGYWEGALAKISGNLKTRMQSELESYWNGQMDSGHSRRSFFAEIMGTCWRTELLKQLQWNSIDSRTHHWLAALYPHRPTRLPQTHIKSLGYKTSKPSQAALANAFLVSDASVSPGSLFVHVHGQLVEFNDQDALDSSLLQELGELPEALSLAELSDLRKYPELTTQLDTLPPPIFENRLEAIIAKQQENIEYVLVRYSRSKGQLSPGAALEAALDIRAMINSKLLSINSRERWSIRLDPAPDAQAQPAVQPMASPTTTPAVASEQQHTLATLKNQLASELGKRPDLLEFALNSLRTEMLDTPQTSLEPSQIYINQYENVSAKLEELQPGTSTTLPEHLLERSVGLVPPLTESIDSGLFSRGRDGHWSRMTNLDMATANKLVDAALVDFLPRFLHRHRTIHSQLSALIGQAMDKGLRCEARQRVLAGTLDDSARALLETVLDSPDSARRKGLRGFIADAFGLTLKTVGQSLPYKLFNCFLITERGGLDPLNSGSALVWTPAAGFEAFDSLHEAENELDRRLHTPNLGPTLLENLIAGQLPIPLSAPLQHNGMSIGFEHIRDNFLTDRVASATDKALGDIGHAAATRLPAPSLQHHVESCLLRHTSMAPLEKALDALHNSRFHAALPGWLANAEADAQLALATLLDQHRQQVDEPMDYLHGIPDLQQFAWSKISALLIRDFPTLRLTPQTLQLSLPNPEATTIRPLTLSEYALLHFDEIKGTAVTLSAATPLPEGLTVTHLNALIKEADIGTHYATLLDSHLAHSDNRRPERQALFNPQLVWQSLEHALRQFLRRSLSAEAHGFIKHLLGMPDGVARTLLEGSQIIVRPLELLRRAQAVADPALGLYLIGRPDTRGPLVLFSPYDEHAAFREYSNESAFMTALGHPGALQQLVLGRIASGVRQYYSEQAFSLGIINLTWNVIKGHFLQRLYHDMTALLKSQLGLQPVQGRRSAWNTVVALLGRQLHQGTRFMLGRLRMASVIWQTLSQFKDSAEHAWQGHWRLAMDEFVSALTQLALSRQTSPTRSLGELPRPVLSPTGTPVTTAPPIVAPFAPTPGWGGMVLTREQQSRLLGYEAHDVALNDLDHDSAQEIYTDPTTRHQYAVVRGRVFQVQREDDRWRIVNAEEKGPWLSKDEHHQWDMDLKGRLLGGGHMGRLMDRISVQRVVRTEVKVLAIGMREIRHLYPDKVGQIRQAHALAVSYLKNARQRLRSLEANTRLDRQRNLFLKEFFGLRTISRALNQRIGKMLDALLLEMLSPARSPYTSELYVVGASKRPDRKCAAFVVICDRTQKIYLNELFFEPGLDTYEPIRPRTFNLVLHNMAAILIHEFSHIVFNTVDIAYLDSFRPFYDLIDNATAHGLELQDSLKELQETALSQRTPLKQLFRTWNEVTRNWDDINGEPCKQVLKLTRTANLEDARWEFLYDEARRIDVILANADSLALLINYLGRPLEFYPIFSGPPA
ncbi:dermonecrotic toxin domain-containing protein [Pseudomonas gingeri]|uniref:dermonecrotic toxin domain-containing protein n=1 Tax=Pseudomonas gingeri TaxID=117681 RepID=UPI0015A4DA42|nr:DUF6543 domain-containing protein [Pseudomonas gingeri]NWD09708.1 hypothetical protein [Pseudomonas gingeri]NWE36830.1 hypothetical protein [Pseudomonas gingeri]NWE57199.1 hypothetical protein [Pseudomonas gingeri]NWF05600.1 hypothetical protein [Pseudomonas gingeri]